MLQNNYNNNLTRSSLDTNACCAVLHTFRGKKERSFKSHNFFINGIICFLNCKPEPKGVGGGHRCNRYWEQLLFIEAIDNMCTVERMMLLSVFFLLWKFEQLPVIYAQSYWKFRLQFNARSQRRVLLYCFLFLPSYLLLTLESQTRDQSAPSSRVWLGLCLGKVK